MSEQKAVGGTVTRYVTRRGLVKWIAARERGGELETAMYSDEVAAWRWVQEVMPRKRDCTKHATTRTGKGAVVSGVRDQWALWGTDGLALPEDLGVLDAPDRVASGMTRESWDGASVHVDSVRRGWE